jgi:predicted O-methyltransferase YrrM
VLGFPLSRDRWMKRRSSQPPLEFEPKHFLSEQPRGWKISPLLENCTLPWAKALRDLYNHPMSCPSSISPELGELVRGLILNIAPHELMEIGCFMGSSTLWIASALAELGGDRKLRSIDLFEDVMEGMFCPTPLLNPMGYVAGLLAQAGLSDWVDLHKGDSAVLGPEVARKSGRKLDFLYIDGDHTIDGCMRDFRALEGFVATGGYIMFHDVMPELCKWEGPAFLLDTIIRKDKRFEVCLFHTTPRNFGLALVRKLG